MKVAGGQLKTIFESNVSVHCAFLHHKSLLITISFDPPPILFRSFRCFSQGVKTQINEEDQSVANNVFIAEVARIYLHVF